LRTDESQAETVETALILDLCSGEYDIDTISRIYGGTFKLQEQNSRVLVSKVILKYAAGLELHSLSVTDGPGSKPLEILTGRARFWPFSPLRLESPHEIILSLTYQCNHRCCYCSNSSGSAATGELQKDEWLAVIDDAASMGVQEVAFSGGEPAVYPHLVPLVRHAASKGIYPKISTNGSCLSEGLVTGLAEAGAEYIHLSLPAVSESLYDRITGSKGDLPLVREALLDLKDKGFYLRLKMVLMPSNIGEVNDLLDFCVDYRVDFVHLAPFRLTHASRGGGQLIPSESELSRAKAVAEQKAAVLEGRMGIGTPPIGDLQWRSPMDIVRCGGVKSKLVIMPNGDVTFCESLASNPHFILGNVRTTGIKDIWRSDKPDLITQLNLDLVDEPCKSCELLDSCRTGCFMYSLVYSGNPWSVDPRCWKKGL
jgi:pyrroloquinoline quinone biosynthesis protein E